MEKRSIPTKFNHEGRKLWGYAAVWDSPTIIHEGRRNYTEIVRRSAFATISQDVICTFNHDPSKLLGRVSSGTLQLKQDEHGLRFEVDLPDTATGQEVRQLAERGEITAASFAFAVKSDKWNKDTRELLDLDLFELGPVALAAYPQTEIGLRGVSFYKYKLRLAEME